MRIDIYSDTVCPWCYLGKRRFELAMAARPQYEPRVTWRPFELNLDMPADGVDRATYLKAKIGTPERVAEAHAELKRQGEASGIEFRFDLIERIRALLDPEAKTAKTNLPRDRHVRRRAKKIFVE